MSAQATKLSEATQDAPKRKPRISPVWRLPPWRPAELVLEPSSLKEEGVRLLLWRLLTDLRLWLDSDDRLGLFAHGPQLDHMLAFVPEELQAAVNLLRRAWDSPGLSPWVLAPACEEMWQWAEANNFDELALQFAELAARINPQQPEYSRVAGNFCRLRGEPHRANRWLNRALRLSRLQKNEAEVVRARLGLQSIEVGLGNMDVAIRHAEKAFRAALRSGNHQLAGCAFHDLLLLKIGLGQYEEAWEHALNALSLYQRGNPRIPALAHDVALLLSRMGYFSAAMTVFEKAMPFVRQGAERTVVLSNLCRAAAACGDRMRYERAMREIEHVRATGGIIPASSWVHLAHAAHNAGDWVRADELIEISLQRSHTGYIEMSRALAERIAARAGGDADILPEAGSEIERIRDQLLKKLEKHTVPGGGPGTVPPERYPLE